MPDISVIVPHLDQPDALRRLLDSLAIQNHEASDFEVIVVDNGSKVLPPAPGTARYNTIITHEPEPGPGPARNTGAALASGRVLAFTDADCIPDPDWLPAVIKHFASNDAEPAIGGDVRIALSGQEPTAIESYESIYGYRQKLYIEKMGFAATCNFAVLKDVFDQVGPFRGLNTAEDRDWGKRASALGFIHAYRPQMLVYTPARSSLQEVKRKWDRHIAHDFSEITLRRDRLRWIARALALALSPLGEIPRIAVSDRVTGIRPRLDAYQVLIRVRFFRARRMIALVIGADSYRMAANWRHHQH